MPVRHFFESLLYEREDPTQLTSDHKIWLALIYAKAQNTATEILSNLPPGTTLKMDDGSAFTREDAVDLARVTAAAQSLVEQAYVEAREAVANGMELSDNEWQFNLHWVREGDDYVRREGDPPEEALMPHPG